MPHQIRREGPARRVGPGSLVGRSVSGRLAKIRGPVLGRWVSAGLVDGEEVGLADEGRLEPGEAVELAVMLDGYTSGTHRAFSTTAALRASKAA